tara:strand:- start:300 stop:518 length:219 start_codon:yes stop_codon:yes gene_type:complete
MKTTTPKLRRMIRQSIKESLEELESSAIFTPEQQMMVDLIEDVLLNGTGLTPVACESAAEEIVNQLQKAGYC